MSEFLFISVHLGLHSIILWTLLLIIAFYKISLCGYSIIYHVLIFKKITSQKDFTILIFP